MITFEVWGLKVGEEYIDLTCSTSDGIRKLQASGVMENEEEHLYSFKAIDADDAFAYHKKVMNEATNGDCYFDLLDANGNVIAPRH